MPDILAIADAWGPPWPASVRYAALVAAGLDGSMTGLCIAPPAVSPPNVSSPSLYAELVEITREQAQAAHRAEPFFRAWAAECGVRRSAWYVASGSLDHALSRAADWYDLLVLARGAGAPSASVADLGRLLLTVGLPCILVPAGFDGAVRFDTVAVAWKGTPQSLRALHAALPLLRRAKRVVLIRDGGSDLVACGDWIPARRIESYLSWQGLNVAPAEIKIDDNGHAPAAILAVAMQESADLLVMGAYGRSRLNEWVFGGATSYALENAAIPLFMRH